VRLRCIGVADKKNSFKGNIVMSAQNPLALLFLLFLIPSSLISFFRFRAVAEYIPLGARIVAASVLRILAFVSLVCALADISWGEHPVLSERSGQAVSFVFDISYSMTAPDAAEGGLSRLDAARVFSKEILRRLQPDTPIAVVVAKGDGMVAVPLTGDRAQVASFLDALSPNLMTAPGSSIGKGIAASCLTFPRDFAYKPVVVVFTDGDETDSSMSGAALDAVRSGISVFFVGFGSEHQIEITAGDGVTRVNTSLKKEAFVRVSERAKELSAAFSGIPSANVQVFTALERGSATRLLDAINKNAEQTMTAEIRPVPRRGLFLALSLLFFSASVICEQFRAEKILFVKKILPIAFFAICCTSCSAPLSGSMRIFTGTFHWRSQNYRKAADIFSSAYDAAKRQQNQTLAEYALFGLAATAMAEGRHAEAEEALRILSQSASAGMRFAAFYNSGILAARTAEYDKAVEYFKNALSVDSGNTDAKLNLEIVRSLHEAFARQAQQEITPVSGAEENPSPAAQQVFSYLRQMDVNQWKTNVNEQQNDSSIIDY
jgi:Ca-activated chloride channel family protein